MPSCKSPKEMREAILRNLTEKTGKTLHAWVTLVKTGGPADRKPRVEWLKKKHGLGHFQAVFVAETADGETGAYDCDDSLLETLFSGEESKLRPLYEDVIAVARKLGADVRVVPCKTYVGLSRARQFAVLKPGQDALYLGLAMAGGEPPADAERVKGTLGGSARITHRLAVRKASDTKKALAAAYALGA